MSKNKNISLWLSSNKKIDIIDNTFYTKILFPCARNCITQYLKDENYSRTSYVITQDFIGNCVLNSINKISNTVPYKFLNKENINLVDTILIYNQWGWERNQDEINKIFKIYDNIILDRVDTLIDYKNINCHYKNVKCEIFSLNKTIGFGGGGLLWKKNNYIEFKNEQLYREIFDLIDIDYNNFDVIDHLQKNNFSFISKKLKYNLENYDIKELINEEIISRSEKLDLLINSFGYQLPNWMIKNIKDKVTFPGIFPLKFSEENYSEITLKLKESFNLNVSILNFNYSSTYLEYDWKKVLPIPLHSEISLNLLKEIIKFLKLYI